jgi:hypothetical protein
MTPPITATTSSIAFDFARKRRKQAGLMAFLKFANEDVFQQWQG